MKLAVIDCGTNTFNLLIAESAEGGKYVKRFNTRIPVRLGEKSINEGYITEAAIKRGLDAIGVFAGHIRQHAADKVLAFATSAIREARNGLEFVRNVGNAHGIDIEVIDGNREAELIYEGNRGAVDMTDKVSLIMDIGGGSNEFILANRHRIYWKRSFMIGAARLLEMFPHGSPITESEKQNIRNYLTEQLQPLILACKDHPPVELIGSSGAFESIVEMIHGELGGEPLDENKTEFEVDLEQNRLIAEKVYACSLEERQALRGLVPMRVDMIVISCLMINHIIDTFGLKKMRVSAWSLKEGALLDFIQKNNPLYGKNTGDR